MDGHAPRFCSSIYSRTRKDQYALADVHNDGHRDLVKVRLFVETNLPVDGQPPLELRLALVDVFPRRPTDSLPWGHRSIDLGYRLFGSEAQYTQFIPMNHLQASTIVCRMRTSQYGTCLASISCDKEGQEPEFYLRADTEAEDLRYRRDDEEEHADE
jgi:hypothetical protein